ncbi:MAG: hypothetical protein RL318_2217 [Fibrobacterota bacterium]
MSMDLMAQLDIGPIVTRLSGQAPILLFEESDFKMAPGQTEPKTESYLINLSIGHEWQSRSPRASLGAGWNWVKLDSYASQREERTVYRNDTGTVKYNWLWVKTRRESEPFLFGDLTFTFSSVYWGWRFTYGENVKSIGSTIQVIFPIL